MCTVGKCGGLTSRLCDAVLRGRCTLRNGSDSGLYIILTSYIYNLFYIVSFYTII